MSKRTKDDTEEKYKHVHLWSTDATQSQQYCSCKAILVSQKEFDRRETIWEAYYAKVRETRAYKRFIEQKEAMKAGNLALVKELAEEARKEIETKTQWIPLPNFPDTNYPKYLVKEQLEAMAKMLMQL